MTKLKKILSSKKGEGYIEVAVAVIVFALVAVTTINVYSFFTLKTKMDAAADQLIDYATYTGSFGDNFDKTVKTLIEENPDFEGFTVQVKADKWHDSLNKTVQYGTKMTVVVSCNKVLNGGGVFRINIPCHVVRSGLSRANFKGQKTAAVEPAPGGETP